VFAYTVIVFPMAYRLDDTHFGAGAAPEAR
jgi:hypothetical protein